MPTLFKGTIIFSGPGHGWTESWWINPIVNSYSGVLTTLENLAQRRALMLGNQCSIVGLRVSQQDLKNDGIAEAVLYTNGGQSASCDSDEPDACLCVYAHDQALQRRKAVFLRGIPDSIDVKFGQFVKDACNFEDNLISWWSYLTRAANPWGWYGRPADGPDEVDVTGYTVNGQNQVVITFDEPLFDLEDVGDKVVVSFSGINAPAKSTLTGQQVVKVSSVTSCTTVKPLAVFPYSHGGKALYAPPEFIPAFQYSISRIATRRVGAPLLVSRGRQRVRGRG